MNSLIAKAQRCQVQTRNFAAVAVLGGKLERRRHVRRPRRSPTS